MASPRTNQADSQLSDMSGAIFGGADAPEYFGAAPSIGVMFLQRLTSFGELVILINGETGEQLTGNMIRDRSIRVAECLRACGIRAGDTVFVSLETRMEFVYIMFGTFILGACLTPLNPRYTEREFQHAIDLSRPQIAFVEAAVATVAAARLNRISAIIIVLDDVERNIGSGQSMSKTTQLHDATTQRYTDFVDNQKVPAIVDGAQYQCPVVDMSETLALILYSSGTTGLPKGVQINQHQTMLAIHRNAYRRRNDQISKYNKVKVVLSVIPLFHTYGCHSLMGGVLFGVRTVLLRRFDAHMYLRSIATYACTTLLVVPALVSFLAKSSLVEQYDLSSVRQIVSGSATLSKELIRQVMARLKGVIEVAQGYGMTESILICCGQTDRCCTPGSVGELVPGVWGRIVDPDTGRVLIGAGHVGEMQFKGNAMVGYVGNPEATCQAIGADGWLRTGDLGYFTEKGEWFLVDRLKELIKYKGFQVAPAELEALLGEMPHISDCCVVGVPDETSGELPMAFVVCERGAFLNGADVERFVRDRCAPNKWLRGGVRFVDEIPRNATGKILRRKMRELARESKTLAVKSML